MAFFYADGLTIDASLFAVVGRAKGNGQNIVVDDGRFGGEEQPVGGQVVDGDFMHFIKKFRLSLYVGGGGDLHLGPSAFPSSGFGF